MAEVTDAIPIQVCYADPEHPVLLELQVPAESTVQQALLASGILQRIPQLDLARARVGIYGKLKSIDSIVQAHDRIEIYRPLLTDPKESRHRRADIKRRKSGLAY